MNERETMDTPMSKEAAKKFSSGEEVNEEEARRLRRAIARINYMAKDRSDLSVASRLLSQRMDKPTRGTEVRVKRVIRRLRRHPQ